MSVVNLDPPIIRPKEPVLLPPPPDTTILKIKSVSELNTKYFKDERCTQEIMKDEASIYHSNPHTIPVLISFVIRVRKKRYCIQIGLT